MMTISRTTPTTPTSSNKSRVMILFTLLCVLTLFTHVLVPSKALDTFILQAAADNGVAVRACHERHHHSRTPAGDNNDSNSISSCSSGGRVGALNSRKTATTTTVLENTSGGSVRRTTMYANNKDDENQNDNFGDNNGSDNETHKFQGGDVVLPKKLIAVFGLESSGSTFLAETLAQAVGAERVHPKNDLYIRNPQTGVEILHFSLPWGRHYHHHHHGATTRSSSRYDPYQSVVDVLVPEPCMCMNRAGFRPCRQSAGAGCANQTGLTRRRSYPSRFFLNITRHITWYRQRGVDAVAVLTSRDYNVHLHGKLGLHMTGEDLRELATKEDNLAKQLMMEALWQLPESQCILVSYESLMLYQRPYLFWLYKQLGIDSDNNFTPNFRDGNAKYIKTLDKAQQAQIKASGAARGT